MKKISLLALALIIAAAFSIQVALSQTDGGQGGSVDVPPPSPSTSSGGGGGHKQIDFDKILKALQEGKKKKPEKFEELQKLININDLNPEEYSKEYSLGLGIIGNKTLTRNDEITISAKVVNPNPIEIRRPMYLYLEVLKPGENAFKVVNPVAQIIQINEYEREDGRNSSYRNFPDLTSFGNLQEVGPVDLRLKASDGQYTWYSKNLSLNVTNLQPILDNISIIAPPNPRYNDAIIYAVNVTDKDNDAVNVTLHVLDDRHIERENATQIIVGEGQARFMGNEFFSKSDAGKNFTYYYSYGDGIVSNKTDNQTGPNLRKSVSIHVENPWVTPEDENQYWWQNYNFTLNMKNMGAEDAKVQVTLFTDTISHPWSSVASKEVTLTQEPQVVYFNVRPFDVLDSNQSFRFKFEYSENDQHQQSNRIMEWERALNAKLVRYETISWTGIGNVLAILLIAFLLSILVERGFYR